MSKVLEKMLAKTGKSAAGFRANSKLGDIFRRHGVKRTDELERILRIPRRDWREMLVDNYAAVLSQHLKRPHGTMTLRDAQAAILTEIHDFRGGVGCLGLGDGKTLVSGLAPTILAAQRPVLLAPAKLRDKTKRDFERLRPHWLIHPKIEFISYEMLSRARYATLLDDLKPDCIVADEAQKLKNLKAGCTKRVKRYMRKNPQTPFIPLSATMHNRTILECWHLLMWALPPDLVPLPRVYPELQDWHFATAEKIEPEHRVAPGALLDIVPDLADDESKPPIAKAREAIHRLLYYTPGIIITKNASCDASLVIELVRPPPSKPIDDALAHMRETGKTPNGEHLEDETMLSPQGKAADIWRNARTMSCGVYLKWVPPAPKLWLERRRRYAKYVRDQLEGSHTLDTPYQVQLAIQQGRMKPFMAPAPDKPGQTVRVDPKKLLEEWLEVRDTFKPNPVAHWIDDSRMRWVLENYVANQEPTIVWTDLVAVGDRLHELSGLPFCRQEMRDAKGRHIEDFCGKTSVIASVAGCGEGANLQAWSRAFVVSCAPNGLIWDQMLGRLHRAGQQADTVEWFVMNACDEQEAGFHQAVADCQHRYQTTGIEQRLLLADIV